MTGPGLKRTSAGLADHFRQADSTADFAGRYLDYMADLLGRVDRSAVARIIDAFQTAHDNNRTLYFLGNGGSAAVATHFVNDIGIGTRAEGERPFKVVSLVDNLSALTAIANDEGYEKIFKRPLEAVLVPDDVVVAMSVSGNSPNVLEAVRFAQEVGALVVGCTGFDGGELRRLADISLHMPTPRGEYGVVEDVFAVLDHLVTSYLIMSRRGSL